MRRKFPNSGRPLRNRSKRFVSRFWLCIFPYYFLYRQCASSTPPTGTWASGFITGQERLAEHRCFLDWLLTHHCRPRRVEVLVVAGDVFDTGYAAARGPGAVLHVSGAAAATGCHDVVVVGGNHDSPTTLNASRRCCGRCAFTWWAACRPTPPSSAARCRRRRRPARAGGGAVPFLRDRDVRLAVAGETPDERASPHAPEHCRPLRGAGRAATPCARQREQDVPVLATGHLFAAGGEAREGAERDVHIGGLGLIAAEHFPAAFDYVALGHLHRPQLVGGRAHIRYSGSPVPLSFTEADDKQQVLLLEFKGAGAPAITACRCR